MDEIEEAPVDIGGEESEEEEEKVRLSSWSSYITHSSCRWAGMENQFHFGYTSYTAWVSNILVKFAVDLYTWEERLMKDIFKNTGMPMGWNL